MEPEPPPGVYLNPVRTDVRLVVFHRPMPKDIEPLFSNFLVWPDFIAIQCARSDNAFLSYWRSKGYIYLDNIRLLEGSDLSKEGLWWNPELETGFLTSGSRYVILKRRDRICTFRSLKEPE